MDTDSVAFVVGYCILIGAIVVGSWLYQYYKG